MYSRWEGSPQHPTKRKKKEFCFRPYHLPCRLAPPFGDDEKKRRQLTDTLQALLISVSAMSCLSSHSTETRGINVDRLRFQLLSTMDLDGDGLLLILLVSSRYRACIGLVGILRA